MMATKSKDSATNTNVGKKEKVGTTGSNPQTKTNVTRPTTSSSSVKTTSSSSSSTTSPAEKQVPNYLKPTISSRHDSAPVGPKPAINRRRSFDNKPPPSSRAPPKTPPTGQQPARSSSFTKGSSRVPLRGVGTGTGTGTGTKPSSQTTLYVKSAKKGSREVFVRKEGPSARAENKVSCEPRKVVNGHADQVVKLEDDKDRDQTKVESKSTHHDDAPAVVSEELEPKSECDHDLDHEHNHNHNQDHDNDNDHDSGDNVVRAVEETPNDDKLESIEDIVVKEDEEKHGDRRESHESGDHQEISLNNCNDNIVASEDEPTVEEESFKEEEDIKEEVKEEETTNEAQVESNTTSNEVDDDKVNDNCNEDCEINAKDLKEEEAKVVVEEEDKSGDHVDVIKDETEEKIDEKKSTPSTTSSSSEKKAQGSGVKKESQIAYNAVIEETASKLLEKRKNKVKALVGAFETVIDYESK